MTSEKDTKTCPFCAEEIKAAAIKCRYCGEGLEDGPVAAETSPVSSRRYSRRDSPAPREPTASRDWALSAAEASPEVNLGRMLPWGSLVMSLAVAGSALMPWAKIEFFGTQTMSGTELDQGKAVLALGLFAASVAVLRAIGGRLILTSGLQFGLASGALGSAVYVLYQFMNCGDFQALCNNLIGEGLYVSVFSSAVLVGLSAVEIGFDLVEMGRGYQDQLKDEYEYEDDDEHKHEEGDELAFSEDEHGFTVVEIPFPVGSVPRTFPINSDSETPFTTDYLRRLGHDTLGLWECEWQPGISLVWEAYREHFQARIAELRAQGWELAEVFEDYDDDGHLVNAEDRFVLEKLDDGLPGQDVLVGAEFRMRRSDGDPAE